VLAQVIVFQVMFPVEATLHAVGKTYSVNVLMTAEVILRVLIVVVMFIALPASIEGYLLVFTGLLAGRAVVEAVILRKLVASVCSESVPTLAAEVNALWSSSVLMLQGLSAFSVFRAPVLLANKVMGSEAAAVISILVATVRTYLYQALISSVQPMMVPIAARIGVREMTQEQVRLVRDLLGAHQTASTALCLFVAITAPAWLDLWLGQTFAVFALAATVMTLTVSVEVSAIVISQVVVSQGYGALLSVANAVMSTVVVAVMVAVSSWWPDPLAVACVISVYVILWHGVISRVIYRQKVGGGIDGLRQTVGTIGLALGVAAVVGYLVSAGERSAVSIAGFGAAGVVMYLGLAEMTLGGGRQMVRAGRSVRAALKRRDP
jgi:hypothetical protein